jgi:SAM-dependent methyltransferase
MKEGSISYSRIADRYEEIRGGVDRARSVRSIVAPLLVGRSVLDVGAGTGIISAEFRDAGFDVVPLDLSAEMLSRCAQRFPASCCRADAQALPFRAESFENVVFVWSLHHVANSPAALSEAFRVLVPGGQLVVVWGAPLPADDPIGIIFDRMNASLRPERLGLDQLVLDHLTTIGFEHLATTPWNNSFVGSPAQAIESLEQRLFAPLWDLDDNTWQTHVEPAMEALRALPAQDVAITRASRHPIVVARRRDRAR